MNTENILVIILLCLFLPHAGKGCVCPTWLSHCHHGGEEEASLCSPPADQSINMSRRGNYFADPWDMENYLYLRAGPVRRRDVCSCYNDDEDATYGSLTDCNSCSDYTSVAAGCPSCTNREYERIAYEEPLYEDVARFGLNTLGHLRIDYTPNWNNLDRLIGRL